MNAKFKAAVGSLLVSGVLAGAAVMPAAGQAANPGDLCWIHWGPTDSERAVRDDPITGWPMYVLASGAAFRVVSYASHNTYWGHGNGQANGYLLRDVVNQATCTP